MRQPFFLLGLQAAAVAAKPISQRDTTASTVGYGSPCGQVSSLVAGATAPTPTVPAQVAWDCIQSVPLNASAALALVDSIKPYVNWQSTTNFLKNPPAEYAQKIQDPVDVWAGLAQIEGKLRSGGYQNEYDFGFDLYTIFQSTHNGHFYLFPDVVGTIFTWGRPIPIVSVSADGQQPPAIFAYQDILLAGNDSTFQPSAIAKINGKDVIEFLEDWSRIGSLQDRDALWNNMFYELAQISLGTGGSGTVSFSGGGRGRWVFPGPTTDLTFANGTQISLENFARVLVPFDGIQTGTDIYQKHFAYPDPIDDLENIGLNPTSTTTAISSASPTTNAPLAGITAPGYPTPALREQHNLIGGYYIDDSLYDDIAVLSVPSFVSLDSAEIDFQAISTDFIAQAKAAGKKKLIIDVSANGGGTILQGYDLFKKLFPAIDPWGATRFRAHEAFDLIGQRFSEEASHYPRSLNVSDSIALDAVVEPFNYRSDLNAGDEHFDSWGQKYGPHQSQGDSYTSLIRWWLSDPLVTLNSGGIEVTGYGSRKGPQYQTQPFPAEDIVIVYDGYCASTCTIFSELMRRQGGVKTVAMSGRLTASGLIQAVGGTKGTNNFPWSFIQYLVEETYNFTRPEERQAYRGTELADYTSLWWQVRSVPGVESNVNARDGIRKGDEAQTPVQFVYEQADCRLYYTPRMTLDVTAIWKEVTEVTWGGKQCAAGSASYGNSTYGGQQQHQKRAAATSIPAGAVGQVDGRTLEALRRSLATETKLLSTMGQDGFMLP